MSKVSNVQHKSRSPSKKIKNIFGHLSGGGSHEPPVGSPPTVQGVPGHAVKASQSDTPKGKSSTQSPPMHIIGKTGSSPGIHTGHKRTGCGSGHPGSRIHELKGDDEVFRSRALSDPSSLHEAAMMNAAITKLYKEHGINLDEDKVAHVRRLAGWATCRKGYGACA